MLEGYRCSVDKKRKIQRVWSFLTLRPPGPLTPLTLRLVAHLPSPSPTVTTTLESTHSGYWMESVDSDLHRSSADLGLMCRPSLNDRKDNMWSSSLKFSTARNTILDSEKFSRVSSLASLVNIPNFIGLCIFSLVCHPYSTVSFVHL